MKSLITLLITVFASVSFAGGSGGGGVVMTPFALNTKPSFTDGIGGAQVGPRPIPEIVFHLGQQAGVVRFAYGQLFHNKWQIQELKVPKADLLLDFQAFSAIERSKQKRGWAEIQ